MSKLYRKLLPAALIISIFQFSIFNFLSCDSVSCPLNNTVASVYSFYASARGDDGVFAEGAAVTLHDTLNITAIGISRLS